MYENDYAFSVDFDNNKLYELYNSRNPFNDYNAALF